MKNRGTLVLLANDNANGEMEHLNQLAEVFGIQFTNKSQNMVRNNYFQQGLQP